MTDRWCVVYLHACSDVQHDISCQAICQLFFRQRAIGLRKVEQLRKLLEARFARAAAIGARSLAADWTVSMGGFIGGLVPGHFYCTQEGSALM